VARSHGQQEIDPERARQIQEALIRANYLDGEPSGRWDQPTKDAISRYQADNGWQTKIVPDSRALIKLGLGPTHAGIINPETSLTTDPAALTGGQLQPGGGLPQ
jgi:peptidoglycan hydrolase-like protein with peptidoglycan-binding domain